MQKLKNATTFFFLWWLLNINIYSLLLHKCKNFYKMLQRLSSIDGSSTIGRSSSLSQEKQGIIQDTGEAYLSHEESKYRVIETVWWMAKKVCMKRNKALHTFFTVVSYTYLCFFIHYIHILYIYEKTLYCKKYTTYLLCFEVGFSYRLWMTSFLIDFK